MSDCQREMTLEEWVYSLPEIHKARKQYEELKALTTPATVPSEVKAERLSSAQVEALAIFESICDVLDGKEVSDFMMSFPPVRQVWDLMQIASAKEPV